MRKTHPELLKRIDEDGFLNPENPGTADYLARFCGDLARRYDIDGIHLDYIRYPDSWGKIGNRERGCDNITRIVRAVASEVRECKPWVQMSCSPVGKYADTKRQWSHGWNARDAVCQDVHLWLKEGLMDAIYPMMYFKNENFYPFAIDWQEQSYGKIVAPGLGTYMLNRHEGNWPLNVVTQEMYVLRSLGLGHTHFRSKFLTDNTKGIYTFARRFNQTPAVVPPMTWLSSTPPDAPTHFQQHKHASGEVTLAWQSADAAHLLYNIYASRTWPVDINDARNIIATRHTS
jgi:uncharacterized lipoprotein YddW (UPF0748 family)